MDQDGNSVSFVEIMSIRDADQDLQPHLLHSAADLLSLTWPQITCQTRLQQLKQVAESTSGFILVAHRNHSVVGVAKLQPLQRSFRDSAAYLTCFVIHEDYRGQGLGRQLYLKLEQRAITLNYVRISLQADAIEFWMKFGFTACPKPVELTKRSRLSSAQQQALEKLFEQRVTSEAPISSRAWMTKAIIEDRGFVNRDISWWEAEIQRLCSCEGSPKVGIIFPVAFSHQVGPSCGLAALRMATQQVQLPICFRIDADRFETILRSDTLAAVKQYTTNSRLNDSVVKYPAVRANFPENWSLLKTAIALGFTYRGEMFSAIDLAQLGSVYYPNHIIRLVRTPGVPEIISCVTTGQRVLIAYDRSAADHRPIFNNAESAHWIVIMGVVIGTSIEFVGQHGMSQLPLVMAADDLLRSNAQLSGPLLDPTPFKIGLEGLQLRDYMVVIREKNDANSMQEGTSS